jgi:hypothetical protein
MSITHLALVNQKLAYAASIIRLLKTGSGAFHSAQKLEQQALGDAAVFHMGMALRFYLRELAEQHNIRNFSAINSIPDLAAALAQADKVSSELSELVGLAQSNDWLGQLVNYHDSLSKSPSKPKEKKAFGQENLIELTELEEALPSPPLPDQLVSWLDSFRSLIARQRETSAEY